MPHKWFRLDQETLLTHLILYLILLCYVATLYTLVLTSLQSLGLLSFRDIVGGAFNPPWWVSVISITLVALTFLPVRRWLLDRVHILVYGQHDNPYALISEVNHHLLMVASPSMTFPGVVKSLAAHLKLPYAAIQAHDGGAPLRIEFGDTPPRQEWVTFPLLYMDKPLGELRVGQRRPGQPLSWSDVSLLNDVARQVAIALHAARLAADLQAAREKLVITREEERRRIRNDLHDGLGPALSSLQLQLGVARNLIPERPDHAQVILDEVGGDLREATSTIRQLVYNLRPPMLDELGLVGALRALQFPHQTFHYEVIAPSPLPRFSAALEVAIYRIATEAVHNVERHAQATTCMVRLEIATDQLELSITDDGKNRMREHKAGIGMHSMRERAAELGGTLAIEPGEKQGTCVVAQFPLATKG